MPPKALFMGYCESRIGSFSEEASEKPEVGDAARKAADLQYDVMAVIKTALAVDCITVATLISTCSDFINNGTAYPYLGSPCCNAMNKLGYFAFTDIDKQSLCLCFIGVITTYNLSAASVIGTLPGFCGVSFGFLIDPSTDCS
ncbi:putative non-specific lipid-transfer protein 14 [Tanacetum coccineum]